MSDAASILMPLHRHTWYQYVVTAQSWSLNNAVPCQTMIPALKWDPALSQDIGVLWYPIIGRARSWQAIITTLNCESMTVLPYSELNHKN